MQKNRYMELDIARAVAVLAMFSFHFVWDLQYFGLYRPSSQFVAECWGFYARFIGSSFLFIAGMSAVFSNQEDSYCGKKIVKRLLMIGGSAAMISVVTWFLFPRYFIFMGILHLLALCSLIAVLVKNWSFYVLFGIAVLIFVLNYAVVGIFPDTRMFAWIGLSAYPPGSLDYYPFFPWGAIFILGMACAKCFSSFLTSHWHFYPGLGEKSSIFTSTFVWMGRNSLLLYVVHQPIFFGLFYAYIALFAV